jgi:hypothetical protein
MFSQSHIIRTVGLVLAVSASAATAQAQSESPWVADAAIGVDVSINGNINSGAIGRLQGQTAAILPNPYGDVYGTGLLFRFGGGYVLDDDVSELRGVFTYQSADANLVRLGDLGPSSLYGQYADYKTLSLDFGYRRYVPLSGNKVRLFGEATVGIAFIDEIDVLLAAPQAGIVFDQTDFYDQTAAFTLGASVGVLFPVAERLDLTAQLGLRRVSGLADVDQFEGTGLEEINDDSARLTFPIVVGARFRF